MFYGYTYRHEKAPPSQGKELEKHKGEYKYSFSVQNNPPRMYDCMNKIPVLVSVAIGGWWCEVVAGALDQ